MFWNNKIFMGRRTSDRRSLSRDTKRPNHFGYDDKRRNLSYGMIDLKKYIFLAFHHQLQI